MRYKNNLIKLLAGMFALTGTMNAAAIDSREVVVEKNEGIVEVPRHIGQVLATPNRVFDFGVDPHLADWQVYHSFERYGVYRDYSYLKHKDNLFDQKTYFDFNDDQPIGAEFVAKRLRDRLGNLDDSDVTYLVVGHADEAGTQSYNKSLSVRRAKAVVDLLVADGYPRSKFKIVGYGKLYPVSFTDQSKNRRVELIARAGSATHAKYKKMKDQPGTLTCRACVQNDDPITQQKSFDSVPTLPIGQSGQRQPSLPTAPTQDESPSATVSALRQLGESRDRIAESPVQDRGLLPRADHNPLGVTEGDDLNVVQRLLNPEQQLIKQAH